MEPIVFRYRSRELASHDIDFIRSAISKYYSRGRSYISRVLCRHWNWVQPNGKLKEYPARDLLLRLEEKGFIKLPPRLNQKNNVKHNTYAQIPIFKKQDLAGIVGNYSKLTIRIVKQADSYLWNYLLHHYHYLGQPKLVGEHLKYLAYLNGQVVACISWASAAWKIKSREEFIGWDKSTKRKKLYLIANNTRFLILPWIRVKHLASKVLALNLKRLSDDWQNLYNHRVYLVETFVDTSRFKGTCYKAANWQYVGQTSGSAKKGNDYLYHGQPKAVYLYPLHRNFRRLLNDDQG
ncbi:MAG: DUF4338 domain-containing protein [Desulfobacterales bacterium]